MPLVRPLACGGSLTARLVTDVDCWSATLGNVRRNTSRALEAKLAR